MQTFMLLADAAVAHPDGTVSVLRGGITRLNVPPAAKAILDGAAVLFCTATPEDRGPHRLAFCITTAQGETVRPDVEMQFETPRGDESFHIVFRHRTTLEKRGHYLFCAKLDGKTAAQSPLEVRDIDNPGAGEGNKS